MRPLKHLATQVEGRKVKMLACGKPIKGDKAIPSEFAVNIVNCPKCRESREFKTLVQEQLLQEENKSYGHEGCGLW